MDTDSGRVEATKAAGDRVTRGGRAAAGALRAVVTTVPFALREQRDGR